jgi:hypothetical protein
MLREFHVNRRLAATASLVALIVTSAGACAMTLQQGVFVASVLLTVAFLVAVIGVAYASDRNLGAAIAALIAATLPLFLVLQAIGLAILRNLGAAVAGGLLLGMGGVLFALAIWMWLARERFRAKNPGQSGI